MQIDLPLPACGLGSSHAAHVLSPDMACAGTLDQHPRFTLVKALLDCHVEQFICKAEAFFEASRRPNEADAGRYYFGGHTITWMLGELAKIFDIRTVASPEFVVDREAMLDLAGLVREVQDRPAGDPVEVTVAGTVAALENNADRVLGLLPNVRAAALATVRDLIAAKREGSAEPAANLLAEVLALFPAEPRQTGHTSPG
jgi:hypothetical protein